MPKNKFIAQPKPARVPGEPNPDEAGEVYIPDYVMRDFNHPRKPPWKTAHVMGGKRTPSQ